MRVITKQKIWTSVILNFVTILLNMKKNGQQLLIILMTPKATNILKILSYHYISIFFSINESSFLRKINTEFHTFKKCIGTLQFRVFYSSY